MSAAPMPLRRVVTGHAGDGSAVVLLDDETPHKVSRAETGIVAHWVWTTNSTPADIHKIEDAATKHRGLAPPAAGTIFRIVDFPPTPADSAALDHGEISRSLGLHHDSGKRRPPRHPLMHATETLDYAIVLSGRIDMMLDDVVVALATGDVVVQQATNHAWINHGPETCRIAFVLIDASPV
jgi:hypothetical protein